MVTEARQDAISGFGTGGDRLTAWEGVVRIGMSARKNAATVAEIRRLAKALMRLEASAAEAISQTRIAGTDHAAARNFAAALEALGND